MEKSNLTSLQFILNIFIDDCISLFILSREKKIKKINQAKYCELYKNIHLFLLALTKNMMCLSILHTDI